MYEYPLELALDNLRGRTLVLVALPWAESLRRGIEAAVALEPQVPYGFPVPPRPVVHDVPSLAAFRLARAGALASLRPDVTALVLGGEVAAGEGIPALQALLAEGFRVLVSTGDPGVGAALSPTGRCRCALVPDVRELGFQLGQLFGGPG